MSNKGNLILLSKEEFEKVMFDIQGVKIKLREKVSRVLVRNPIIFKRVPDDWTVDMLKKRINGCVVFR